MFYIGHPIRTLIILVQDKHTSLKLPVGVCRLQLVNLYRNRRYFVIKLHTWFCLSYFMETNITLYCIYQYFMSINSFFNTLSVCRYSRPITVTRDPLLHVLPVFFLIMFFNIRLKTNIINNGTHKLKILQTYRLFKDKFMPEPYLEILD